ncbi:MAG TPA: hypothetical protein VMT20_15080 [Terriglobia bacterium]|nr:hypothetical protein [Terriglobia bacterium]
MRNTSILAALLLAVAVPAFASSTSVTGTNSFGSESFGFLNGSGYSSALAVGTGSAVGEDRVSVTPRTGSAFNASSTTFGIEGYSNGNATFNSNAYAHTQGTTSFSSKSSGFNF